VVFWEGNGMKKGVISIVLAIIASGAHAENKPTRFWNLTVNTITALQMSPAGKQEWGINQCKNDRDGTVDHDERLRITDVSAGRYDVRLVDKAGRTCIVRDIDVKEGAVFIIEEKQLTDCRK
jgi:hypothetical protein